MPRASISGATQTAAPSSHAACRAPRRDDHGLARQPPHRRGGAADNGQARIRRTARMRQDGLGEMDHRIDIGAIVHLPVKTISEPSRTTSHCARRMDGRVDAVLDGQDMALPAWLRNRRPRPR
jgi:hypothetical protein